MQYIGITRDNIFEHAIIDQQKGVFWPCYNITTCMCMA